MSDHMMSNGNVLDLAPVRDASPDMDGYSLMPDIVWPHADTAESQYNKVIFMNVKKSYPPDQDLICTYMVNGIEITDGDIVSIFSVEWRHVQDAIISLRAPKLPGVNEEFSVVFPASHLPGPGRSNFYQFCYMSDGELRGASIPFIFLNKDDINADEESDVYLRNSPEINILPSTNMAAGHPPNFTSTSGQCTYVTQLGASSDGQFRNNTTASVSSYSEVTSMEQYIRSLNETQQNLSDIPMRSVFTDHNIPGVASTSQGLRGTNVIDPLCPCDSNNAVNGNNEDTNPARVAATNIELRKRVYELECQKQFLVCSLGTIREENDKLRHYIGFEANKNQALMVHLHKCQMEVGRQSQMYDINQQNVNVVISELENQVELQRFKIDELQESLSEKDKKIAHLSERFGGVNEKDNAVGGRPPPPQSAGHKDGQFKQQGQVDIGENSGMQRQNIKTSKFPRQYSASLRKTRNYYGTFLDDAADIEQKLRALSNTKLSFVKNLHKWSQRKESIFRTEYQNYLRIQNVDGTHFQETGRICNEMMELLKELEDLNFKADDAVGMIDEIKRRLVINRNNLYVLRDKASDVFNKFIENYKCSIEQNGGEGKEQAQADMQRIQTLYTKLENKFKVILRFIGIGIRNTYKWS